MTYQIDHRKTTSENILELAKTAHRPASGHRLSSDQFTIGVRVP